MPRGAAAGAFGLFAVIGAVQALYGPALPVLERAFDITPASAATVVSAHFVGGVTSLPLWGAAQRRMPTRHVLAVATAALSAGCAGVAAASVWGLVLASALVAGIGFGGVDLALNVLFATSFGSRSALMLNLLNASFGVGAIAGPLAAAFSPRDAAPLLFAATGAVGLALLPLVLGIPEGGARRGEPRGRSAPGSPTGRGSGLVGGFVVLYVLYVGVETGVGAWEPTHLASLGVPAARAALSTSLFWAGLTAGRLLAAPISVRVTPETIMVTSLTLAVGTLAAAHLPGFAPAAYALTGLALAPVFPTGLAWLTGALPTARGATTTVVGAAMLGGVAFPTAIGWAVGAASPAVIPGALAAIAAAALVTALGIRRAALPASSDAPGSAPNLATPAPSVRSQ
jgi:fucose permease